MINRLPAEPAKLVRVRIEYADGTTDTFENLSSDSSMLVYGWQRDEPHLRGTSALYTNGSVACFLFKTMLEQQLSDQSDSDPRSIQLMRAWQAE